MARSKAESTPSVSLRPIKENDGIDEPDQEAKFLTEALVGYNFWNRQPGDRAKSYAEAYKALLNEFTKEDKE